MVERVQVVQATDTIQQNATRHGLDWNSAFDPTATFEDIEIRNNGAPLVPPSTPTAPSPTNAATGVALGTPLSWSAPGATTYDISFGTMNPPVGVSSEGLASPTWAPILAPSTTYYWQVTARNGVGSAVGPVWSFTTAALPADLLLIDTFTDTNGTLLPAHIPERQLCRLVGCHRRHSAPHAERRHRRSDGWQRTLCRRRFKPVRPIFAWAPTIASAQVGISSRRWCSATPM
jgi:hypothetical protein